MRSEGYIKLVLLAEVQGLERLEEMRDGVIDDGVEKGVGFE